MSAPHDEVTLDFYGVQIRASRIDDVLWISTKDLVEPFGYSGYGRRALSDYQLLKHKISRLWRTIGKENYRNVVHKQGDRQETETFLTVSGVRRLVMELRTRQCIRIGMKIIDAALADPDVQRAAAMPGADPWAKMLCQGMRIQADAAKAAPL